MNEVVGQVILESSKFSALVRGETIIAQIGTYGAHDWEAVEIALDERLVGKTELEQAQAQATLLYGVATAVKTGLAHSHRELGAECGEVPCTLCWLHGTAEEALAALAEIGDS